MTNDKLAAERDVRSAARQASYLSSVICHSEELQASPRCIRRYTGLLPLCCHFSSVAIPKMISIVDDDLSVREGLSRLLSSAGFLAKAFASAEEYLSSDQPGRTDCLLLDVRMPGMSGIELERQLVADHFEIPVVFITAHQEETAPAQVLDGNARTVLIKPFSEEALLNAINNVLDIRGDS